jgi:uncharacterized glyoxalase superfamily protein PhnB
MDDKAETTAPNSQNVKVLSGVVPYITVGGAVRAAELYQKAFGATVAALVPPDDKGRTMHCHLYINGGSVMLSDAYPEHGHPLKTPQGTTLTIVTNDCDFWWKRAVDAGLTVRVPLEKMFWGERYGVVEDPFGYSWAITGQ